VENREGGSGGEQGTVAEEVELEEEGGRRGRRTCGEDRRERRG
jgi:hypothetical protein